MNTISSAITSAELGPRAVLDQPRAQGQQTTVRTAPRLRVSTIPANAASSKLRARTAASGKVAKRAGAEMQRNAAHSAYALRSERVTAEELQSAVLLVLALYASIALLDLRSELPVLVQHWRTFVEFLASTLFTVQSPS